VVGDERGEIDIGERVAGDDEKRRIAQKVGCEFDGARGTQWRIFHDVLHRDAEGRAVAEITLDFVGEIMQGGDDLGDAVTAQQIDDVLHHGLVRDGRERLGPARCQRT